MIELLVVIVVIAILAALLMPAIAGAVRRANEAAVQAEQMQLGTALAEFRSRYGEYPPSRILICEDGGYGIASSGTPSYSLTGPGDISDQDLARRSVAYLRRFWPRLALSTTPSIPTFRAPFTTWYDVNGNGGAGPDIPYVLAGDECLAFFLGGVPRAVVNPGGATTWSATGFARSPANPFPPAGAGGSPAARSSPLFEFRAGRLADLDGDGVPSYLDPLKTGRAYAYFSSYAGAGYDPNDVNASEPDDSGSTAAVALQFRLPFPVAGGGLATSPAPNPYTVTTSVASPVSWQAPLSFQIVSAGVDGLYGVGGMFAPSSDRALPLDASHTVPATDPTIRIRERDNLTSFATGSLD